MQPDPFGNLKDWGPVLEQVYQLADDGKLSECQPGLTRILTYRDNWRLREETLKKISDIERPNEAMIRQVLRILTDENLYYEVRILAGEAMMALLKKNHRHFDSAIKSALSKTLENQLSIPQPPIFEEALKKLHSVTREIVGMS